MTREEFSEQLRHLVYSSGLAPVEIGPILLNRAVLCAWADGIDFSAFRRARLRGL